MASFRLMAILEGFQCLVNECTECGGIHLAGGGGEGIEFENVLEAETERAGEVVFELGGVDLKGSVMFLRAIASARPFGGEVDLC